MIVSALAALSPAYCHGDEPAQAFIDALRQNGYYDLALNYLDQCETSKLISDKFRKRIPLERSRTLVQSVNKIRDPEKWEASLSEAQKQLAIYSKNAKDKESQASALFEQASLYRYQSRVYIKRSESERLTKTEKEEQLKLARGVLEKSLASYTDARASYNGQLKQLRAQKSGPDGKAKRNRDLETGFVKSRLYQATVNEALAETYTEPGKQKEFLEKAAEGFNEMWENFNHLPQGVDACLFAARTHYKLSELTPALIASTNPKAKTKLKEYAAQQRKKALERVDDIFLFPKSTDFLVIKRKAAGVAADVWDKMSNYPFDSAIESVEPLVTSLSRRNKKHPEWLKVQLALAKAYRAKAEGRKKAGAKPSEVSRLNKQAGILARSVSKLPSDVREESIALLEKWNINVDAPNPVEVKLTFELCKNKCRELASELGELSSQVSRLRFKIAAAKNDTALTTKLTSELEVASAQLKEQSDEALKHAQCALKLANEATSREDLNFIRYLQCFTHYSIGNDLESVVIGEFLLDRYATITWTQQAAGLAVKSHDRIEKAKKQGQPEGSKTDSSNSHLANICERVIKRWPGTPQAVNSAKTMANRAIKSKDFSAAMGYLETMPKDNTTRAELALKLGQSLWFEYDRDEVKEPAKLTLTTDLLTEGVSGYNKENLTYPAALGALWLTKALVAKDEIQMAIDQLESPKTKVAPLDLVKQKHNAIPASRRTVYEKETYKAAISVYLRAMETGESRKWIDKVESVLEALKVIYEEEGPKGQAQLISIYKLVAAQLTDQFGAMEASKQKVETARSIEQFLTSLSNNATDSRTVLWAGSTMLEIGDELRGLDAELQKRMYSSAAAALKHAGDIGFEGDPNAAIRIRELKRQQAIAKRGAGRYEEAIEVLVETLREHPAFLQAQVAAAETLQQWGKSANLSKAYVEALGGRETYKDPKTGRERDLIWGWKRLAQNARRTLNTLEKNNAEREKIQNTYRKAYLARIECLHEYGLLTKNQEALGAAKKEIANITTRNPELFAGGRWQREFDELANRINNSN